MPSRTPTFIWIPFVFSIGTISWVLLLAGLVLLAAVVIAPALNDVKTAEIQRNDYQATLALLDQKIALQQEFIAAANHDPELMDRLASRQLNRHRPDQEPLPMGQKDPHQDRSVETLLAESLKPVEPQSVPPMPILLAPVVDPRTRPFLITIACAALAVSFFLGVKYDRT